MWLIREETFVTEFVAVIAEVGIKDSRVHFQL